MVDMRELWEHEADVVIYLSSAGQVGMAAILKGTGNTLPGTRHSMDFLLHNILSTGMGVNPERRAVEIRH